MATTTPFLDERGLTVWNTDARRLPDLVAADGVDALVTDPPYELALGSTGVSARWDSTGIAFDPAFWASLLPVMKPGAFAFVFGSPRTWHRLACAMEDAGWRLRDQIAWLYSSGMPKGEWGDHAVDRTLGHRDGRVSRARGCDTFSRARVHTESYTPQTPEARAWSGWNPALKPAWEPILVAQRPRTDTLGRTLLEHGTGALNAGAGAIGADMRELEARWERNARLRKGAPRGGDTLRSCPPVRSAAPAVAGRHPSDVAMDADAAALLPAEAPAFYYCPKAGPGERPRIPATPLAAPRTRDKAWESACARLGLRPDADTYPALLLDDATLALTRDAGVMSLAHPTVKPVDLISWLVRLSTRTGGLVMDPFCGSGTIVEACARENRRLVGTELETGYLPLIRRRAERPVEPALL